MKTFLEVTEFIKNNTVIPAKLRSLKKSQLAQLRIEQLMWAIEKGLLNYNTLFSDPDCELYLLDLLEAERISIEQFLTVQIYLSALMEYTDKQPVKEDDESIKDIMGEVILVNFDDIKDLLFDHLEKFLKGRKCSPQVTTTILDTFERNTEQKPNGLDNIVLKIGFLNKKKTFLQEIQRLPLIFEHKGYFYIPSVAVMTLILRSIHGDNSELPVKFYPMFGDIKPSTLRRLRRRRLHPISLYSKYVKSNPNTVHGLRLGPLNFLLHDLAFHFCKGNITFTKTVYSFVYQYLIDKVVELFGLSFDDFDLSVDDVIRQKKDIKQLKELFCLIDLNMKIFSLPTNDHADGKLAAVFLDVVGYDWKDPSETNEKIFKLFEMLENDRETIQKEYHIDLTNILAPVESKTRSSRVILYSSEYNDVLFYGDNDLIEVAQKICSDYYKLYQKHKLDSLQNKVLTTQHQETKLQQTSLPRNESIQETCDDVKQDIKNYIDDLEKNRQGSHAVLSSLFEPYSNSEKIKIDILKRLYLNKPPLEQHKQILEQDQELQTLYTRLIAAQQNLEQHSHVQTISLNAK